MTEIKNGMCYLLVLKTGENLLATINDVSENDDEEMIIHCENLVAFMPDQQGKMLTIPYLQFSKEIECDFNVDEDIRHILTPNDELGKYYATQFSKIIVPDSGMMKPTLLP